MLVKTDSINLIDSLVFVSLFSQSAGEQTVKTSRDENGSEVQKLFDGKVVYRTSLKALKMKDGEVVGEEKSVSLALLERLDIIAGVQYVLDGDVWLTHYVNNFGRLGCSIVAERVVASK